MTPLSRHIPRVNQGFSLIEAVISALVLGVALLALARMQASFLAANAESRLQAQALNLAQEKIEALRDFPNRGVCEEYTGTDSDSHAGPNATFTRAWTLSECPNTVNCMEITVTVSWTDARGDTQNIDLTSYTACVDPIKAGVVLLGLPGS